MSSPRLDIPTLRRKIASDVLGFHCQVGMRVGGGKLYDPPPILCRHMAHGALPIVKGSQMITVQASLAAMPAMQCSDHSHCTRNGPRATTNSEKFSVPKYVDTFFGVAPHEKIFKNVSPHWDVATYLQCGDTFFDVATRLFYVATWKNVLPHWDVATHFQCGDTFFHVVTRVLYGAT